MKTKKVLIVGCGDIGVPLGLSLIEAGASVWGLKRDPSNLPKQINPIKGDVTKQDSLGLLRNIQFDYVVVTLTPTGFSDDAYRSVYVEGVRNIHSLLCGVSFKGHLIFVSSTSVYHQNDGEWVNEQSATLPESFSGKRLLEAEQILNDSPISSTVVRFSGIYGPGRRRLIKQVQSKKGCLKNPPIYTNRIHRDDCVGFLAHLIIHHYKGRLLDNLFIGTDSCPVTMWDLKQWLAVQLGIDVNTMDRIDAAPRSSKRCSNQKLLASGYQLLYPDYKLGYQDLVKNEV